MSRGAEVLKILMMSIDYVSAEKLEQILGVSRITIDKAVNELVTKGFVIDMNSKLGYRLVDLDDLSKINKYVEYLDTEIKFSVNYIEVCDSTQDIAFKLAEEGAPEGTVVLAEELKRGRGRLGRQWVASRGGLWLSLILRPRELAYINLLSLAIAVAVIDAIKTVLGVDAKVKWPNDVILNEKKVAGILIEGSTEANTLKYAVVGIGVNVNNVLPQELISIATTLKNSIGFEIPRIPLLLNIFKNIDDVYILLKQNQSNEVIKRWRKHSSTINRYVKIVTPNEEIKGLAEDVESDGALRIRTIEDKIVKVYVGDVIHLREQNPTSLANLNISNIY
ncbi:MAG: biotin--[acetyl-CoA-carboxylase] ligase [Ignisphaera sp.]|uniref:Biotin--[acetyl-CoA-carboxylase] ligase n=1 Tax=Ignisphaera aggregans TaxID=334771 RepID=A0A7C4JIC9_9CREN